MALFMISGMIVFVAIVFLLWCLQKFSDELKRSKAIQAAVHPIPVSIAKTVFKQNARRVIQMQNRHIAAGVRPSRKRHLSH